MMQWMKFQQSWHQDKLYDAGSMQRDMQAMQSGDGQTQWAKNLADLVAANRPGY